MYASTLDTIHIEGIFVILVLIYECETMNEIL